MFGIASPPAETLSIRRRSFVRTLECDGDVTPELVQRLWRGDLDQLLEASAPLQVKDRCAVGRYDHPHGPFLLKRYVWGDWSRTARMVFRTSAARSCARLGLYLAEQGVATPRPRAAVECRLGPLCHRSYLLTDFVPGTTLFRYIRCGGWSPEALPDLARQVAAICQRLVDLKISHNDLKPENFIVDSSHKVWLIDLEKARSHRDERQLRRRHLDDWNRLLHVRTWRTFPEAMEPFRAALLATALGGWLRANGAADHPALRRGFSPHELASGLSVVILAADDGQDEGGIAASVESVYDIADEILLVRPSTHSDRWDLVTRLPSIGETSHGPCRATPSVVSLPNPRRLGQRKPVRPRHPWVLVLAPGERATPELAKRLPERIVERDVSDAYHVPVEARGVNGRHQSAGRQIERPIRLFHQRRCSFSFRRGQLVLSADPAQIGQLAERLLRDHAARIERRASNAMPAARAA